MALLLYYRGKLYDTRHYEAGELLVSARIATPLYLCCYAYNNWSMHVQSVAQSVAHQPIY